MKVRAMSKHGAAQGYCAACRSVASADSAVDSAGVSASSGARVPGSDTDDGSGALVRSSTAPSAAAAGRDGAPTGDALGLRLRLRLGRAR